MVNLTCLACDPQSLLYEFAVSHTMDDFMDDFIDLEKLIWLRSLEKEIWVLCEVIICKNQGVEEFL